MSMNKISILNINKYHNLIIYGKDDDQVKNYLENELVLQLGSKESYDETLINSCKNDIENRYRELHLSKCRIWDEFNKSNSSKKMPLKIIIFSGTAKEISSLTDLLPCLTKAFAVGYRFIIGITDGKHPKLLQAINAHCEIRIDLCKQ